MSHAIFQFLQQNDRQTKQKTNKHFIYRDAIAAEKSRKAKQLDNLNNLNIYEKKRFCLQEDVNEQNTLRFAITLTSDLFLINI